MDYLFMYCSENEQMCKVQTVKLKKPGFALHRKEQREDNFTVPILISDQWPTCGFLLRKEQLKPSVGDPDPLVRGTGPDPSLFS